MRQVGSYLSDTSRMLSISCQFLEADRQLYVSYMRQDVGYRSATYETG